MKTPAIDVMEGIRIRLEQMGLIPSVASIDLSKLTNKPLADIQAVGYNLAMDQGAIILRDYIAPVYDACLPLIRNLSLIRPYKWHGEIDTDGHARLRSYIREHMKLDESIEALRKAVRKSFYIVMTHSEAKECFTSLARVSEAIEAYLSGKDDTGEALARLEQGGVFKSLLILLSINEETAIAREKRYESNPGVVTL